MAKKRPIRHLSPDQIIRNENINLIAKFIPKIKSHIPSEFNMRVESGYYVAESKLGMDEIRISIDKNREHFLLSDFRLGRIIKFDNEGSILSDEARGMTSAPNSNIGNTRYGGHVD